MIWNENYRGKIALLPIGGNTTSHKQKKKTQKTVGQ